MYPIYFFFSTALFYSLNWKNFFIQVNNLHILFCGEFKYLVSFQAQLTVCNLGKVSKELITILFTTWWLQFSHIYIYNVDIPTWDHLSANSVFIYIMYQCKRRQIPEERIKYSL